MKELTRSWTAETVSNMIVTVAIVLWPCTEVASLRHDSVVWFEASSSQCILVWVYTQLAQY